MIDRGILFTEAMTQFEKSFIFEVLRRCDGNQLRAAETLKSIATHWPNESQSTN